MRWRAGTLLLLGACARERTEPPRAPPPPPPPPYRVMPLAAAGRVEGTVVLRDSAPSTDVVLWLDDVRAGKSLPLARRYELDHERSTLVPRVQAALIGGTLNVRNMDETAHRARFTLEGGPGGADSLLGVVEETGAGQLVPSSKMVSRTGLIVVTCDQHPATRGWLRVFDQPYFTMPDSVGRFAIDSVPRGRWRLRAWRPDRGPLEMPVVVDSAGVTRVEVRFPN